jgi:hypothetical protein
MSKVKPTYQVITRKNKSIVPKIESEADIKKKIHEDLYKSTNRFEKANFILTLIPTIIAVVVFGYIIINAILKSR